MHDTICKGGRTDFALFWLIDVKVAVRTGKPTAVFQRMMQLPKVCFQIKVLGWFMIDSFLRWFYFAADHFLPRIYSVVIVRMVPNTKGVAHNCHQGASTEMAYGRGQAMLMSSNNDQINASTLIISP